MLALASAAPSFAQQASDPQKPSLQCDLGPAERVFGEVQWIVYACRDGHTIVFFSKAKAGRDLSFYFIVFPQDKAYRIVGEGVGDRTLTKPAFEGISAMSPDEFRALHAEAAGLSDTRSPGTTDPQ